MPQRTNWDAGQHWLPCHLYRPEHCPGRQWGQPSVTGHCHSPFKLGTWICRKQNPGNLLGNSSDSGAIKAWGCPCCLSSLFISSPVAGVWTAEDRRNGLFSLSCLTPWTSLPRRTRAPLFPARSWWLVFLGIWQMDLEPRILFSLVPSISFQQSIWRPDYTV